MTKIQKVFEHLDFGFVWDLGFRAYDLLEEEVMKWQKK